MSEEEKFELPKSLPVDEYRHAEVAELVDAQHSGCCGVIPLGVRLPPSAPRSSGLRARLGLSKNLSMPPCLKSRKSLIS